MHRSSIVQNLTTSISSKYSSSFIESRPRLSTPKPPTAPQPFLRARPWHAPPRSAALDPQPCIACAPPLLSLRAMRPLHGVRGSVTKQFDSGTRRFVAVANAAESSGLERVDLPTHGCPAPAFFTHGLNCASTFVPKVGAECGNSVTRARTA